MFKLFVKNFVGFVTWLFVFILHFTPVLGLFFTDYNNITDDDKAKVPWNVVVLLVTLLILSAQIK